jgi:hypothetical protein
MSNFSHNVIETLMELITVKTLTADRRPNGTIYCEQVKTKQNGYCEQLMSTLYWVHTILELGSLGSCANVRKNGLSPVAL